MINQSSLIEKARDLAYRAHAGQTRKYTGTPYITHPAQVASLVSRQPWATDVEVAAAWLHDLLEDGDPSYIKEFRDNLPTEVIRLVEELTNPSKGSTAPRHQRKQQDRNHLQHVSVEAKRIKLIDRNLNIQDIPEVGEEDFLDLYLQESALLLQALQGAEPSLEAELSNTIRRRQERRNHHP